MTEIISKKWFLPILLAGIIVLALLLGGNNKRPNPIRSAPRQSSTSANRQLPALEPNDGPWECLQKYLPLLKEEDHELEPLIGDFQQVLVRNRAFTRKEFEAKSDQIRIDFIYNEHPSVEAVQPGSSIDISQRQTESYLEASSFDLLGIEARYADSLTLSSLRQSVHAECKQAAKMHRIPFGEEMAEFVYNRFVTEQAPFRYLTRHPDQAAFGIERPELHMLHSFFLERAELPGRKESQLWTVLNTAFRDARSEMALARALAIARTRHAKKVVIVYGAAHRPYMTLLCNALKIQSSHMIADGAEFGPTRSPSRVPR